MDVLQLRNFRDFLLLYNQISESCFKKCANTFLTRQVTTDEDLCVQNCALKYINANHKSMEIYVELQSVIVRKRMEEMNKLQAEMEASQQQQQQQQQQEQQQQQLLEQEQKQQQQKQLWEQEQTTIEPANLSQ